MKSRLNVYENEFGPIALCTEGPPKAIYTLARLRSFWSVWIKMSFVRAYKDVLFFTPFFLEVDLGFYTDWCYNAL